MIKKAFISGFVSVLISILVFGTATVFGDFPSESPPGGLVSPTFSSVSITGEGAEGKLWTPWITSNTNLVVSSAGYLQLTTDGAQGSITLDAAGTFGVSINSPKGIHLMPSGDSKVLVEGTSNFSGNMTVDGQVLIQENMIAEKQLRVDGTLKAGTLSPLDGESLEVTGDVSITDGVTTPYVESTVDENLIIRSGGQHVYITAWDDPFNPSNPLLTNNVVIQNGELDVDQVNIDSIKAKNSTITIDGNLNVSGEIGGSPDLVQVSSGISLRGISSQTTNALACPVNNPTMISCNMYFTGTGSYYAKGPGVEIDSDTCLGHYYQSTSGWVSGFLQALCM